MPALEKCVLHLGNTQENGCHAFYNPEKAGDIMQRTPLAGWAGKLDFKSYMVGSREINKVTLGSQP